MAVDSSSRTQVRTAVIIFVTYYIFARSYDEIPVSLPTSQFSDYAGYMNFLNESANKGDLIK